MENIEKYIYVHDTYKIDDIPTVIFQSYPNIKVPKHEYREMICYILKTFAKVVLSNKYKKFNCCVILNEYTKCDLGLSFFLPLSKVLKKNFVGNLHNLHFVDAPKIFKVVFKIGYYLMDKETREKITFINQKSNKETEVVNHMFL